MRISRAPEHRGGAGSPILLVLVLLAIVVVGGVVVFLLLGRDSVATPSAANPAVETQPVSPIQPANLRDNNPVPPAPIRQPAQLPVSAQQETNPEPSASSNPFEPPRVDFGEVVAEGFVDLELLNDSVRTWYTLHLDSSTRQTTFFFAFFDPATGLTSRTVMVRDYSQAQLIDNAEVTIFYPDYPERVINFDRDDGTIVSRQFYTTQPYAPSIFSRDMRISLIHHGLGLNNASGDIQAEVQIDLTGIVSDREGIAMSQIDPPGVARALDELQLIIDQIESRRRARS